MLPPGLGVQATRLRFRFGGFLTWAAKPSVRESPDPASDFTFRPVTPAGCRLALQDYVLLSVLVPLLRTFSIFSLDAARFLLVARLSTCSILSEGAHHPDVL